MIINIYDDPEIKYDDIEVRYNGNWKLPEIKIILKQAEKFFTMIQNEYVIKILKRVETFILRR